MFERPDFKEKKLEVTLSNWRDVLEIMKAQAKLYDLNNDYKGFLEWIEDEFDWIWNFDASSDFCEWALKRRPKQIKKINQFKYEFFGKRNQLAAEWIMHEILKDIHLEIRRDKYLGL